MTRPELALQAVKVAGVAHLRYFRKPLDSTDKNPRDIVTIADTEAEKKIIALLQTHFPGDSIIAEESGVYDNESEYQWVIDPLDGTSNFFKGSPDFCVLIALLHNKQTVYGVTWFPVTEELYIAEKGKGATLNGSALKVSSESSVGKGYGNTHMSSKLEARRANLRIYEKLLFEARNIHVINACIARLLCDVASGRAEFHFRVGMNVWDYVAGVLLIDEAGGKSTELSGVSLSGQSKDVLATNSACHEELLGLVSRL